MFLLQNKKRMTLLCPIQSALVLVIDAAFTFIHDLLPLFKTDSPFFVFAYTSAAKQGPKSCTEILFQVA